MNETVVTYAIYLLVGTCEDGRCGVARGVGLGGGAGVEGGAA